MNKKILFLALLAVLALPVAASAQITITGMVANVANIVWTVATIIVVIMWIITGILFLTAQGAPEKLKTAKTALFAAIAGTIIVIVSKAAMNMITTAITTGQ